MNEIGLCTIQLLKKGTPRQREAYETLLRLGVFISLSSYTPVLTGTIPIDVDIETSDLDIVCEAHDLDAFDAMPSGCMRITPVLKLTGRNRQACPPQWSTSRRDVSRSSFSLSRCRSLAKGRIAT